MAKLTKSVGQGDHTRGAKKPQFQIVEYGDFQCPYCGAAEPIVEQIYNDFGDVVSITFRNFPLSEMHEMALPAAQAAEAAGEQNKYWEMHDSIYANQSELSPNFLMKEASDLKLDIKKFEDNFDSKPVKTKIEEDFESGVMSGVNGTPTFFVNEVKFEGGAPELYNFIKENYG